MHGEKQKDYIEWKSKIWGKECAKIENNGYSKKTVYRFNTKCFCYEFNEEDIINSINPMALAILYMDDGSLNGQSCNIYSAANKPKLLNLFRDRLSDLGINTTLRTSKSSSTGNKYSFLYIKKESYDVFFKMICPYIIESMSYKIPNEYKKLVGSYDYDFKQSEIGEICVTGIVDTGDSTDVYDIEVEDNHNFIISNKNYPNTLGSNNDGVVVHNCQDTSGAQHKIVDLLMNYWQQPNILAVGDPNQCIFEFASARIQNINDFIDKYNPKQISLNKNYRSTPTIVDTCEKSIANNEVALNHVPAVGMKEDNGSVSAYKYKSFTHENFSVFNKIKKLTSEGVDPSRISVIYRKHAHANDLLKALYNEGIPVNTRKRINILDSVIINQIITILEFLNDNASAETSAKFFEILHYDFFDINRKQIERLLILLRSKNQIKDLDKRSFRDINKVYCYLTELRSSKFNSTPIAILEKLFTETGINEKLRGDTKSILTLKTFFDFVKDETVKNPRMNLDDLLSQIKTLRDHNMQLSIEEILGSEDGIMFSTAHGSKGLEFEYVFLIRMNISDWEKSRNINNNYAMPPNITFADENNKEEAMRRLFYVAMSRAERYLEISCSEADDKCKGLEPSKFLIETEIPITNVESEDMSGFVESLMQPEPTIVTEEIDRIKPIIDNYTISVSHINSYLRCPLTFYYERILRLPFCDSPQMVLGSAIHNAIDRYYKEYCDLDKLIWTAENYITKHGYGLAFNEQKRAKYDAKSRLIKLYNDYLLLDKGKVKTEYKIGSLEIDGMPVYGELDKIEFEELFINIVDWKVSSPESIKKKIKKGEGDYWRQAVMYKLLAEGHNDSWYVNSVSFRAIGTDPQEVCVPIDQTDIVAFKEQMRFVYDNVKAMNFKGCGDPSCKWCNIVSNAKV